MSSCQHCGARDAEFRYGEQSFCCECMSELCSWFLDGGISENPEQFPELTAIGLAAVTR